MAVTSLWDALVLPHAQPPRPGGLASEWHCLLSVDISHWSDTPRGWGAVLRGGVRVPHGCPVSPRGQGSRGGADVAVLAVTPAGPCGRVCFCPRAPRPWERGPSPERLAASRAAQVAWSLSGWRGLGAAAEVSGDTERAFGITLMHFVSFGFASPRPQCKRRSSAQPDKDPASRGSDSRLLVVREKPAAGVQGARVGSIRDNIAVGTGLSHSAALWGPP